jgi:hypothetical protein
LSGYITSLSTIKNCVAANSSVTATSSTTAVNRIVGGNPFGDVTTLTNNYALTTMKVNGSEVTSTDPDSKDGKDATSAELQSLAFYQTLGWDIADDDAKTWRICEKEADYPFLSWEEKSCPGDVYTITATVGANGSITPSGTVEIEGGDERTFVFYPEAGYKIDQALIDNVNNPSAAAAGSYTFTNVTANHTIHVTFIEDITGIEAPPSPPEGRDVRVYPNPTTGELVVSTEYRVQSIEIFDVMGRSVGTYPCGRPEGNPLGVASTLRLDISHLQNGIYFVRITTENGIITKKIIKN